MQKSSPVIPKHFQTIEYQKCLPVHAGTPLSFLLAGFLCFFMKPLCRARLFIPLEQTIYFKQCLFIYPLLQIMGQCKYHGHPYLHMNTASLQNPKYNLSGIHQLSKQQKIKILILLSSDPPFFLMNKMHRLLTIQNQMCGGRAGQGQGNLPKSLEFLHMPRIQPACPAEHPASSFQKKITQIFLIQKCAAPLILTEALVFPVDLIVKAVSKDSFFPPVLF